jgi:site-specific DNA-methyltransferase (adenine-specific)
MLDEQSGECPVSGSAKTNRPALGDDYGKGNVVFPKGFGNIQGTLHNDSGGASRFFYIAKASRGEREKGLSGTKSPAPWAQDFGSFQKEPNRRPIRNLHPTVKPLELMRYLVRLVTPKDGICLDPFLGSGTTLLACRLEGFDGLGIEKEPDYEPIIRERLAYIPPPIESFDIEEDEQAHLGDGTIDRDRGKVH